jgi:hypothetical protein
MDWKSLAGGAGLAGLVVFLVFLAAIDAHYTQVVAEDHYSERDDMVNSSLDLVRRPDGLVKR